MSSNGFLSSSSNMSTTRLITVLISVVVSLALLIVTITAAILTIKGKTVDWMGMSAFIGSVTLILGTVITGKVSQKNIETKNRENK